MAAGSRAVLTVRDFATQLKDTETSPVNLTSYQIDAANLATWLTGFGTYKTALQAICLGVFAKEVVVIYDTLLSGAIPTSPYANRESKILMTAVGDTTGKPTRWEIPAPNLAALTRVGKDGIELADAGVMAAYVAADEALRRMPEDDTETVTIASAQLVGRNI